MSKIKDQNSDLPRYIVGIGASAGGLEALERFFDHMPPNSGLAFVIVQHLSPDFKSLMDEILARHTTMAIHRVKSGMEVEPNSVYLIPARKTLTLSGGKLWLTEPELTDGLNLPIDIFFRSLAEDAGKRAIAIILSGSGSDGSRSLPAIHQAGGLILAQSKESAGFEGMPGSAIATGLVDVTTTPEFMPNQLLVYVQNEGKLSLKNNGLGALIKEENELSVILGLLRHHFHIDFTQYKPTTVLRRIERRMTLAQAVDVEEYLLRLKDNPTELDVLYRDLLIEVTQFFRDPEAFQLLRETVIPQLLGHASPDNEIRIWVPGCATGEEAYSLAILFDEVLQSQQKPLKVRIFATDAHRDSLQVASAGKYRGKTLANVSPERLDRYFEPIGDEYQVNKSLRQMVIFAPQNLIQDPPFTRLDLISCRNVLIYFQTPAQQKVIDHFRFGLKINGVLMLGPGEHGGTLDDGFETIDRRWRIYRKRREVQRSATSLNLPIRPDRSQVQQPLLHPVQTRLGDEWMEDLLAIYVPAGVLLDENHDVIYLFGEARNYFRLAGGRGTLNVFKMVEGNLYTALRAALHRAKETETSGVYDNIRVETDTGPVTLKMSINPLPDKQRDTMRYFVGLQPHSHTELPSPVELFDTQEASQVRMKALEDELSHTKAYLQATIEEIETTNEELQSTNEELVASNEELQSTNEELHSVNEELYTVNAEYQRKIEELSRQTNDLRNLQHSTKVGVVFLDSEFAIRSFTPALAEIFRLLPQDIGRPLQHLAYNIDLDFDELSQAAQTVLIEGTELEYETQAQDGNTYLLRMLPYNTEATDAIEGVVLTFIDITERQKNQETIRRLNEGLTAANAELAIERDAVTDSLRQSEGRYWAIINSQNELVARFTPDDYTITFANQAYCRHVNRSEEELLGQRLLEVIVPEDERAHVADHFSWILAHKQQKVNITRYPGEGNNTPKWIRWSDVPIIDDQGQITELQSVGVDITDRKKAEFAFKATTKQLQTITDNLPAWIAQVGTDYRFRFANRKYSQLIDQSPSELIGMHVSQVLGVAAFERSKPYMDRALAGETVSVENQLVSKTGDQTITVQATYLPDIEDGQVVGFFALVIDVTELKEQAHFIERITAANPNLIYVYDLSEKRIVFLNREITVELGYTAAEVQAMGGNLLSDLVHPDDRAGQSAYWEKIAASQDDEIFSQEFRMRHKNGHWRWFASYDTIFKRNPDGSAAEILGSAIDITEQKEAEAQIKALNEALQQANFSLESRVTERTAQLGAANKALQRNVAHLQALNEITFAPKSSFEEKLEQLLTLGCRWFGLPIGIFSHINKDNYRVVQAVAPENTIKPGDEFPLGNTYCAITFAANKFTSFIKVSDTEWRSHPALQSFQLEAYIGMPVWVGEQRYGTLNFSGPEPRSQPFEEIDTELLKLMVRWIGTEIGRQLAEEQFRNYIESAPDAIVISNSDGEIVFINGQAETLFGYSAAELIGQGIEQLVPTRLHKDHISYRTDYHRRPETRPMGNSTDLYALRKDGTEFPTEISLSPVKSADGESLVITSVRDVTEQIEARNALAQHALELARSNADLDRFVSIAAHDLKEPLRGIQNYCALILSTYGEQLVPEACSQIGRLAQLAERATTLVNDLRIYSQVGRRDTESHIVNLDSVVDEVLGRLQSMLGETGVKINRQLPLPTVTYNRAHLQTIIQNLITNGIKYNDKDDKLVEISFNASQNSAGPPIFYIRDNGIGIPEKHHQRIFDMFKRLHPSHSYGGGTGAGLALVKKILEANGGQIWLESEPGVGTTFYFTLE